MIQASEIVAQCQKLEALLGPVDIHDVETWTMADCEEIKDALYNLGIKASIVFVFCMTDEEMAAAEREGMDLNDQS